MIQALHHDPPRRPAPLQHRSGFTALGTLQGIAGHALEDQSPLFAADPAFAREHGGPITQAFLEMLPRADDRPVVIDSSLVWLAPGLAHTVELGPGTYLSRPRSPLRFIHEPFPCVSTGFRDASNRNRDADHYLCVVGLDCTPQVAVGEVAFNDEKQAEAFWHPTQSLDQREAHIERWLAEGVLTNEAIPLGSVVRFGWGSLMRATPATTAGFQFVIRATFGDDRPIVNGLRNMVMI